MKTINEILEQAIKEIEENHNMEVNHIDVNRVALNAYGEDRLIFDISARAN